MVLLDTLDFSQIANIMRFVCFTARLGSWNLEAIEMTALLYTFACICWRLVYRTCVFVFFWPMGWVGVGWGGLITFNGTSTHIWCYASDLVSCTCTHTWCYATDLVSCTCTHTWCYATDLVSCTCIHTWCYATDLVSCTCTILHTYLMLRYRWVCVGWGGMG